MDFYSLIHAGRVTTRPVLMTPDDLESMWRALRNTAPAAALTARYFADDMRAAGFPHTAFFAPRVTL